MVHFYWNNCSLVLPETGSVTGLGQNSPAFACPNKKANPNAASFVILKQCGVRNEVFKTTPKTPVSKIYSLTVPSVGQPREIKGNHSADRQETDLQTGTTSVNG